MTGLGDLPGGEFRSFATDASLDGSVIVGAGTSVSGLEAFVWDPSNGMRELDQVLMGLGPDLTGWTLEEARGVSHDGLTVAGYGTNPSRRNEAWIAVLPEPSTGALLGAGLGVLAASARWRHFRG